MTELLTFIQDSAHRPVWLDDANYAAALLAGGNAPWLDATSFVAWRRRSQSLFKSDVVSLPAARVCRALVARDKSLADAMGAKTRANFPLKTLLASNELRSLIADLLAGLRSCFPAAPLALICPSPRAWVQSAYSLAFSDAAALDIGENEVDQATLHCADFLRVFADSGLDTVLLEESLRSEPADANELAWYGSVLNVAAHYRWSIGVSLPGKRFAGVDVGKFSYVIAPRRIADGCFGASVEESFWRSGDLSSTPLADFNFAEIPLGLEPELILDRIAELR